MPKTNRWFKRLGWAAATLGLLAAAVGWGLPALLESQLPPRLSQALGRPVTLTAVEIVPWQLDVTVRGLRIGAAGEAPGAADSSAASSASAATTRAPALLQIERLHADLSIASLRRGAPVVEALDIDGLRLNVARTAAGHYDIDDLLQRLAAQPKKDAGAEPARFSLNNVVVRDAQIQFDDRPAGQVHRVQALTLTLPFLSNLPDHVDIHTEPRVAFQLNGTQFDTGTDALPFKESKSGALSLKFKDLDLKPALGYLPAGLPAKLLGARLSSDLSLRFALPPGGAPSVAIQGDVALHDVALAEPDGTALAGWRALTLQLTDVQPLQRRVGLGTLKLDGAELRLARDAQSRLNLQRLLAPKGGAAPAASAAPAAVAPASVAPAAVAGSSASPWTVTLARLQLNGTKIHWTDDAVRPQAALQVDDLGLQVDGLRWPSPTPVPIKLQGQLRQAREGAPVAGRFSLDGQVQPQSAALALQVDDFDLATLAPYLAQTLKPRLSGQFAAKATVDWAADPAALVVKLDSAGLKGLQLRDASAPRAAPLASLRQLSVSGVDLNLTTRRVSIGKLQLVQPALAVSRNAEGQLNLQQWLVAAPAPTSRPVRAGVGKPAPDKPWRLTLRDASVTGGQLKWLDAQVRDAESGEPVQVELSGLKLRLQGLAWPATAVAASALPRLQVAARIGSPATPDRPAASGDLDWNGRFGLAPVQADGQLQIKRFPVHLFVPYAGQAMPLHLQHADASFQGQVRLLNTPAGWRVGTEGDAQLTELQLNSPAAAGQPAGSGAELLTWQSLSLQGLSLALAPPAKPQLVVREVALDDFYSRLQITEDGRFNLQDVAAGPAKPGGAANAASTPASAAAAAPEAPAVKAEVATAASPSATASAPERLGVAAGEAMAIDIGGIQLRNGKVDFSDQFIRPNYSAQLTELNGSVGRLRSGTREMATIALRGRAAGTALLDISGQFNPTANPLALDIRARATDLELAPLSPYAGRYAGYGIERGKLSVDVSYKIDADGKLDAKNQVTLNQLTFGEKVDSPTATKLPVLLAVSLLTDRNGVIDINLPVSGSVSDPKFSVGGIIWQVIVNLLTKAVTAPFALLAGGGSGPDLSVVQFQPGTAHLADSGRESLAKVATALGDRPALIMTVTGSADAVSERDATQRAVLDDKLQAERRRERLRQAPADTAAAAAAARPAASAASAAAVVAAPEPPLAPDERARLLKRLYQQTALPNKPRNALGLVRDLPPAEMEALLLAATPVTEVTMRELALQRGLAVRDALIAGGLASERLFLAAPKLHIGAEGDAAWVPQVSLTLSKR